MADGDYTPEPDWKDDYTGTQEAYEDYLAASASRESDIDKVEDALDSFLRKPRDELSSPHDLVTDLSAGELLDVLHRAGLLRIPDDPGTASGVRDESPYPTFTTYGQVQDVLSRLPEVPSS